MTHLESLTKKLHALLPETRVIVPEFNLEHVMKAVDEIRDPRKQKWLFVNQRGRIWSDKNSKEIFVWAHCLPLDKQSPELIEWLDNLIPEQPTK